MKDRAASERNMLWMLFADDRLAHRIVDWDVHAPRITAGAVASLIIVGWLVVLAIAFLSAR
jgi:hypothetical protein